MKSLFDKDSNQQIINRMMNLEPNAPALWGKMSVDQMVAHCQKPLRVAVGEVILKRTLIGLLFGSIARKQLLSDEPLKKNLPTDRSFIIRDHRDFKEEKNQLIELVQRFAETGEKIIKNKKHPFFGVLTSHEWDWLQWKHLDHHLRQFGA